jgi:hypothetical protein
MADQKWNVLFFVGTYNGSESACELVIRPDGSSHWGTKDRRATTADWVGVVNALINDAKSVNVELVKVKGNPFTARDAASDKAKAAWHEVKEAAEAASKVPTAEAASKASAAEAAPAFDYNAFASALGGVLGPMVSQAVIEGIAASKGRK